jgi:hypothetical protein
MQDLSANGWKERRKNKIKIKQNGVERNKKPKTMNRGKKYY